MNKVEINSIINAYNHQNYDYLSENLNDNKRRIKFEKWLIHHFSQDKTFGKDFAWHTNVISLICKKIGEDSTISLNQKRGEDLLIANLISRATPLPKGTEKKYLAPITLRVRTFFRKMLDFGQIYSEIKSTHLPSTCRVLLTRLLSYQNVDAILQQAILQGNIAMVEAIAQQEPEKFKAALKIQDKDGATPLHSAATNMEIVRIMANTAPEEFKAALKIQDKHGWTPLKVAAAYDNMEIVRIMADTALEEFKAALKMQDQDGWTPLKEAVANDYMETIRIMANTAPEEFKAALKMQDQNGWTPLKEAVANNHTEIVRIMANTAPEEFKAALKIQNKDGWTPVHAAAAKGHTEIIRIMANSAPEGLKAALKMQDQDGWTPLYLAATNMEIVRIMADAALEEFKAALKIQDKNGWTPLKRAVAKDHTEIVKIMANTAPKEFKAALKIQDKDGGTPLMSATNAASLNLELIKLLITDFDASNVLNNRGESALSILKKFRPNNHQEAAQLFKENIKLRQLRKNQLNRKALSHAWHLSGMTSLIQADTKENLTTLNLEGHFSAEWFHLMSKHLSQFSNLPDLLSADQIALFKHVLDLGANAHSYSLEDKLERIQAGLPTIINTGFNGHSIILLIWGDQFIICNRGAVSRRPIEIHHFDPTKLDLQTLKDIEALKDSEAEKYRTLFFTELPKKLNFSQSALDLRLEKFSSFLPAQTIGNCSFLSPITAIFAFILIGNIRGIDSQGSLSTEIAKPQTSLPTASPNQIKKKSKLLYKERIRTYRKLKRKSLIAYQAWLSNLQMSILENNIRILEKENSLFKPDHRLIREALYQAHQLTLRPKEQEKLDELTTLYLQSLEQNERTKVKIDIDNAKSLERKLLL